MIGAQAIDARGKSFLISGAGLGSAVHFHVRAAEVVVIGGNFGVVRAERADVEGERALQNRLGHGGVISGAIGSGEADQVGYEIVAFRAERFLKGCDGFFLK